MAMSPHSLSSLALGTFAWSLALSSALALSACSRCSNEPRVPFKLNPQATPLDREAYPARDAAAPTARVFEAPVDKLLVGDRELAISHVLATLEIDLDNDGDRDLLALRADDNHTLQLLAALSSSEGFAAPRGVAGFAPDLGDCSVHRPSFVALSAGKATLSYELVCASAEATPRTAPFSSLALLSIEAAPRVFEHVDVIAGDDSGQPALTLSPHSVDADGDGHDDVALTVTGKGSAEPDALELVWLDRPSGLVRDPREPEATLAGWATTARGLLAKTPEQAIARAELALTLSRAVCREPGFAQLTLGSTPGIPCGTMKSTGALLTTLTSAYAKRGELRAAFDSYRGLRRAEPQPSERELERATSALQKLSAVPGVTMRRGPRVEPVRAPRVHLPSASFLGEGTLYVQRFHPVLYDLARDEETAAPSESDHLLRDPSGLLIATAIERSCDGYAVRIERAPPRGSDYTVGAPVASAVLAPSPAAPGCNRSSTRADDGGFTLLGWAPQGLLAVRGSDVRLVPLASDGRANGAVRALAPDAPRPAPLASGSVTADGARYVEATPYGVLIYGPVSTRVELWRPEGYTSIAHGALEAAISPSARKVAVVAGSEVYILERE